jgi:hypothetical protein
MLLVFDNASVHKADELKKLMEQYGIILMFLPPNMTKWMHPLDRVVCGLIKIVQRARRGRHLAVDLKQWKQEQERIVGEAFPPPPARRRRGKRRRRRWRRRSEEEEEQYQPTCRILWFLNLTIYWTARRRRGKRRRRRRRNSSIIISRRLPSMMRHGKDPGDRRRSVS